MKFSTLIGPEALRERIGSPQMLLVDCRFDLGDPAAGERAWSEAHIPGAMYAHLDRDLSGQPTRTSGRHPLPAPEAFADTLGRWGVTPETQVVAYDASAGMIASRLWWMLRWAGHDAVAVLDGGLQAWRDGGGILDGSIARRPRSTFDLRLRPQMAVGTPEVVELLRSKAGRLVDARSVERFKGLAEPIDPVAGHVPGAVNVPCQSNLGPDGRFRAAEELGGLWQAVLGGDPADAIVCMCGSGVTACHNLLALEHAGLPGARLYVGSWSEWIRDPARPVAGQTGS